MTDPELIQLCKKNDRRAQKALFDRYAAYGMSIVYRYLPNHQVDDVFLKAFQKAFTYIENFDSKKGNFKSWFARIIVNESLNQYNKNKKNVVEELPNSDYHTAADEILPNLNAQDICRSINALKEPYKTIFNMVFDGYSYKEVSEVTGVTEVTCRSYYKRSRQMLVQLLHNIENASTT